MTRPFGKLGCNPSRRDARTLQLAYYRKLPYYEQPPERRWDKPIDDWGIMGNDNYGNCTIVTPAHAILAWAANESGDLRRIADSAVIELSREMGALDGYNILDRLNWWRKKGMWANRLWAYAQINPADESTMRTAINNFGCADIALSLPLAWQGADVWDTGYGRTYRPNSWGGHSVPIVGYDTNFLYVVTWGYIQTMTWQALAYYSDEAYALINPSWLAGGDATTPSGFDLTLLHADLQKVTQ